MGKPTLDQCEGIINHFSHQHPMQLYSHSTLHVLTHASCSGCHDDASGSMYKCSICNYYLHKKCAELPQKITHPYDQEHVLCLFDKPKYQEGIFNCDACGKNGGGFSYRCETCGTDLHIICASLPIHCDHHCHFHQLTLSFSPAYPKKSFSCAICQSPGSNVWFYRCSTCEFDVHLSCMSAMRKPGIQQGPSSMISPMNMQNPMAQVQHLGQPQNQPHVMGMPCTTIMSSSLPQNNLLVNPTLSQNNLMINATRPQNNLMMNPTLPQNNPMMNPTSNPSVFGYSQPIAQQPQQMVQQIYAQQQQAIARQQAIMQQQCMAQKQVTVQVQQQMMTQQQLLAQQQMIAQQQFMAQKQMMAQQQGGNVLSSLVNGMASGISQAATGALLQGVVGGGGGMMTDPTACGVADGSEGVEYTSYYE